MFAYLRRNLTNRLQRTGVSVSLIANLPPRGAALGGSSFKRKYDHVVHLSPDPAYGPVAVWAFRTGGLRRLWLLCALTLLAVTLLAVLLSAVYSVPSARRVVIYSLAFLGPSILLATGSLWLASGFTRALPVQLMTALSGIIIGLAVGFVVIVYVLRVW